MKPHHLVLIIFVSLILFLFKKRNNTNKFHLDYFLYHILFLFQLPLIYTLTTDLRVDFKEFYLYLLTWPHIVSYVFIILHIESCLKGHRVRIKFHHLFLPLVYLLFCTLNYYEIYLFNFSTKQTVFFDLEIKNQLALTNILIAKQGISVILIAYLFWTFRKNIKNPNNIKKKVIYSTWIYSYILIFLLSFSITFSLYYGFFDPNHDTTLSLMFRTITVINIFYFALFPSVLFYLPLIKKEHIYSADYIAVHFGRIDALFKNEEIFLKKDLTLSAVSLSIGLNEKTISETIKNKTGLNFKGFVNKHRIDYSIKLMKTDFLKNRLIDFLGEKAGFKSKQTFYRAFKEHKNHTPSQYYKNFIKE